MVVLKRLFQLGFKLLLIGFITLVLFEICYRCNIVDFYKTEQLALNSIEDLNTENVDVLVFGDSFSATSKEINYIDKLRNIYPDKTILNFSIPGTGIKQLNTFAKEKIKKYKPKTIIYQIYVGNDLLDVERFNSYQKMPILKNMYWQASNVFLSLAYLNHKVNAFKPRVNYRNNTLKIDRFSEVFYNKRSKDFLSINSNYLEETVTVSLGFKKKYKKWLKEIKSFLDSVPKSTEVYFVWIPHCTQVNNYYLDNFKLLNASFKNSNNYKTLDYPFYKKSRTDLMSFKNLKSINTLEAFKMYDTITKRVFFANDPHLNNYGNIVLANRLKQVFFKE